MRPLHVNALVGAHRAVALNFQIMSFDINEAREIVEAAKKRGIIRVAGSAPIQSSTSQVSEKVAKEANLPEWLRQEIEAPSSNDKPMVPEWRSA
jgi:hypothetical protein